MLWRVILLGVLTLSGLVALPPVARAQIACGASITTNTGLTGNLDCSNYQYDPIHIDADNVTFKLNGHTLTCSSQWGWYYTPYEFDVEGIRATGRTGVKILGPGKITNCGRAITFEGGSNNTAQGLYLTGNLGGVTFIGGANSTARDNVIIRNGIAGIGMSASVNIQILENYLAANGGFVAPDQPNVGWGITNDNASTATIANNSILGHETGGIGELGASVLAAQITNNIILGNGAADLSLRGTDDVVTGTSCETSTPPGLCPSPLPRFPTVSLPTPTAVGVFRPSEGNWYIRNSQTGTVTVQQWGTSDDVPVPGDYDGDGKTDIAVWRPSEGNWYITPSSGAPVVVTQWGTLNDIPVPGDYDGDGKTDIAVWRPAEGNWYIINSATGAVTVQQWGTTGDLPVVGKW